MDMCFWAMQYGYSLEHLKMCDTEQIRFFAVFPQRWYFSFNIDVLEVSVFQSIVVRPRLSTFQITFVLSYFLLMDLMLSEE